MHLRNGFTIIEILVVLLIMAIFVGLLLPAIHFARETANKTICISKIRDICIAGINYASSNANNLPDLVNPEPPRKTCLVSLLPYLESSQTYADLLATSSATMTAIPSFLCPSDPIFNRVTNLNLKSITSYAANTQVFANRGNLLNSFSDGTSNTILFSEHYSFNCGNTYFRWDERLSDDFEMNGTTAISHRASFADGGSLVSNISLINTGDAIPITIFGSPSTSVGSINNLTFQQRPVLSKCDPRIPQTPHNVMPVALADCSVRVLAPGITPSTFWAAVTPSAGEILGSDW